MEYYIWRERTVSTLSSLAQNTSPKTNSNILKTQVFLHVIVLVQNTPIASRIRSSRHLADLNKGFPVSQILKVQTSI